MPERERKPGTFPIRISCVAEVSLGKHEIKLWIDSMDDAKILREIADYAMMAVRCIEHDEEMKCD